MKTNTDVIEYETNLRDARRIRAEEMARIYSKLAGFFRARRPLRIVDAPRRLSPGKHGASLWPSV